MRHIMIGNVLLLGSLALAGLALVAGSVPISAQETPKNMCRLILPAVVPAVVGQEVNIYFDNTVLVPDSRQLIFDVNCAKGMQQVERWTYVPQAADVGDMPLSIDVRNGDNDIIASAKTIVRVAPADSGAGKEARFLIVGDSLTHHSVYPEQMLTLCKAPGNPKLTLLGGHHEPGFSPENVHEGWGGWTFEKFVTFYTDRKEPGNSSPFTFMVNGKVTLDFKRWIKDKAEGKAPDFVTIELGCNDIFGSNEENQQATIDHALGFADILVANILSADPNIKLGLVMLTPPAGTQDAFGNNYGCGQTRWQYLRNQHRFLEVMQQKYADREKERIYLIPTYLAVDPIHGYPTDITPVNARTTETITRLANGVHPSTVGYNQMGDSVYAWTKVMMAKP